MFVEKVTPRFGDIDGLRHITNTVPPMWFELARNPLFKLFVPDLAVNYDKWNLILVRMEFDFVGQLYFGADVEIRTYIEKIGNTSFTVYQEAWQNGGLGVKGKAVCVYFDFKEQKPKPIPEDIKLKLKEHIHRREGGS
jgi:acyl-CoA thioester hydrolase